MKKILQLGLILVLLLQIVTSSRGRRGAKAGKAGRTKKSPVTKKPKQVKTSNDIEVPAVEVASAHPGRDIFLYTEYYFAAYNGSLSILENAVLNGKQFSIHDANDFRVLSVAAKAQKTKVLIYLLEFGLSVNTSLKDVLFVAIEKEQIELAQAVFKIGDEWDLDEISGAVLMQSEGFIQKCFEVDFLIQSTSFSHSNSSESTLDEIQKLILAEDCFKLGELKRLINQLDPYIEFAIENEKWNSFAAMIDPSTDYLSNFAFCSNATLILEVFRFLLDFGYELILSIQYFDFLDNLISLEDVDGRNFLTYILNFTERILNCIKEGLECDFEHKVFNMITKNGSSVFDYVLSSGNPLLYEKFAFDFKLYDLNRVNLVNETLLQRTLLNANFQLMEHLVKSGADLDLGSSSHDFPLIISSKSSGITSLQKTFEFVKSTLFLLDEGANPNIVYEDHSFIYFVLLGKNEKILEKLLEYENVILDIADSEGDIVGIASQRLPLIQLIMKEGINVLTEDVSEELFPLFLELSSMPKEIREGCMKEGSMQNLANTSFDGFPVINFAVETNQCNAVEVLLKNGARMNKCDSQGRNALDLARELGFSEVVSVLEEQERKIQSNFILSSTQSELKRNLKHGAQVNGTDNEGKSALYYAMFNESVDCTRFLLRKGASFAQVAEFDELKLKLSMNFDILFLLNNFVPDFYPTEWSYGLQFEQIYFNIKSAQNVFFIARFFPHYLRVKDSQENSLLHFAAKDSDITILKALVHVTGIAALNCRNLLGESPLMKATQRSHIEYLLRFSVLTNEDLDKVAKNTSKKSLELFSKCMSSRQDLLLHNIVNGDLQGIRKLQNLGVIVHKESYMNLAMKHGQLTVFDYLFTEEFCLPLLFSAVRTKKLRFVEKLLKFEIDLNTEVHNMNLLNVAVVESSKEIVSIIISEGAAINHVNSKQNTSLLLACQNRLDFVEVLLENGADPLIASSSGRTPLHTLASVNSANLFKIAFSKTDPVQALNIVDSKGNTLLHSAISANCQEIVEFLVESGANINTLNRKGKSPLKLVSAHHNSELKKCFQPVLESALEKFQVAFEEKDLETVKQLLSQGYEYKELSVFIPLAIEQEDLESLKFIVGFIGRDFVLDKFLHLAVSVGNIDIIDFIVENIKDIDFEEPETTMTALQLAAKLNEINALRILVPKGANIFIRTSFAESILDLADDAQCKNFLSSVLEEELGKFARAVSQGDIEKVKFFIKKGIDPEFEIDGKDALHFAVESERSVIVEYFMNLGMSCKFTHIEFAVENSSQFEVAKLLIAGLKVDEDFPKVFKLLAKTNNVALMEYFLTAKRPKVTQEMFDTVNEPMECTLEYLEN